MSSLPRSFALVAYLSFPPWCPTGNAVVVPGRDRSGMDILSFVAVIKEWAGMEFGDSLRAAEDKERYCCNVICNVPTTAVDKGLR